MAKITNILVPVDYSEASKKSLIYAKEMAEKFDATITLLNVYELPMPLTGYEYSSAVYADIEKDLTKYAQEIIDGSEKQIANPKLKINKIIVTGNQGMNIVDTAENNNCDLIIMGSRGLSAVKSFLLGSVSNYVIHHSKIPVFLVY